MPDGVNDNNGSLQVWNPSPVIISLVSQWITTHLLIMTKGQHIDIWIKAQHETWRADNKTQIKYDVRDKM